MEENKFVITIGRQFGCGAREIGELIARKMGIKYYDKELLFAAAENTGVSKEFFEQADERFPNFFESILSYNIGFNGASFFGNTSPISSDNIYTSQSKVMEAIANKESCVIVGRSADYILRNHKCCINIFINANIDNRINRIVSRKDCLKIEDARQLAEKKDKLRAEYYNFYTDKEWGNAKSYDITFDSSKISIDDITDMIIDYTKKRIALVYQNK